MPVDILKPFMNKKNGQISLHPKKKDLSKKELKMMEDGKLLFKIKKVKI